MVIFSIKPCQSPLIIPLAFNLLTDKYFMNYSITVMDVRLTAMQFNRALLLQMLVQINVFLLLGLLKVNITRSVHPVNPLDLEKNSRLTSFRNYYPYNILF